MGKKGTKEVLKGVSGLVQGGSVMAIMGPSGSGKTSLLHILSGQRLASSGTVELNGEALGARTKRHIGMVPQEDVLLPSITVEEALSFSAALRVPMTVPEEEKKRCVEGLLKELGLESIRSSIVGDSRRRRGISGGEKKRCSIGVEMVHRPRVLLLDEPTSGLDSAAAHQLLLLLQELARTENVAVAFTIHQPSSRDFALFDKLLVLSEGSTVYCGDAAEALPYLASLGHHCPPRTNPAEFILDMISGSEDLSPVAPSELVAAFARSKHSAEIHSKLDTLALSRPSNPTDPDSLPLSVSSSEVFATPFTQQFRVLLSRAWLNARRNPVSTHAAAGRSITMGLIVGMLYTGVGLGQASVQDRTGALYFVLTTQIFSAQASMRMFLEERDLFLRERSAGAYRTSAYFWSKSIADTPLQLLFALMFSLLGYFLVGLQMTVSHVSVYCLSIILTTLAAESYVVMIGAIVPDDKLAAVLGPVAFGLMSLFGGFFLNIDSLPFYLAWMQYLSLFRYSFSAIMQNEFRGLTFTCDMDDTAEWVESLEEGTREHVEEFLHLLPCPVPDGEKHLKRLKLDHSSIPFNLAVLFLMILGFRLMGFIMLRRRTNKLVPGARLKSGAQGSGNGALNSPLQASHAKPAADSDGERKKK